ncbi:MAG TPA: acetoacetate--CoA ligase, partial [Burkholderiales bacterium]|nr:acetoacetate--CoA ligase [Burkholderiales bacterium]
MSPLWTPSPERAANTELARFMKLAGKSSYAELHRWSVEHSADFWELMWKFGQVRGEPGARRVIDPERMPGAQWFPDAKLNYAENLLRSRSSSDAIIFWGEDRIKRNLTYRNLHDLVSRLAQALKDAGVKKGDRVAGYLPNLPESTAALLATASLGAVWSSCSPDFGVQGVLDRFGQIEPKVLFCADGYLYGGKEFDSQEKASQVLDKLPSVEECVVIDYLGVPAKAGTPLVDFLEPFDAGDIAFEPVEFNHPLYILYSSGTTGVPKCIVHGTGGSLLQHLKEHRLQSDVKPGDRLFYFTTLGWMMWNWLVSGLASEATLLLYDGSPFVQRGRILFDFAEAEGMTHFGTSAKFIDAVAKTGLKPKETHRLDKLRAVLSTGSPLAPEGFDYVYQNVKSDVCLSSISGGTDIVSCFVLGNPTGPVWRGEIQAKGLGMAVEVFDEQGRPVRGEKGELVCTRPFPSMPVGFWNDP